MEPIDHLLKKLIDFNAHRRLDTCIQLTNVPELSTAALSAMQDAVHDPDHWVGNAAYHALSCHESGMKGSTSSSKPPQKTLRAGPTPSIIGNLSLPHWLFLIVGTGMVLMTIKEGNWGVALFMLLFFTLCIVFMGLFSLNSHAKLLKIWSEVADQTGLVLEPGHANFIGNSIPPSLSGIYDSRRVSIYKEVEEEPGYEGSIPVVYTCTALEVRGISPQKFYQLVAQYSSHLDLPKKAIMLTDYPFAFTTRRPSSIYLEGWHIVFKQHGVPAEASEQVEILNLLCHMADLAEFSSTERDY